MKNLSNHSILVLLLTLPLFFLSCKKKACKNVDCSSITLEIDVPADSCCMYAVTEGDGAYATGIETVEIAFDLNYDGSNDVRLSAFANGSSGSSYGGCKVTSVGSAEFAVNGQDFPKQFDTGDPLIPANETWASGSYTLGSYYYSNQYGGGNSSSIHWAANNEAKGLAVRSPDGSGGYKYGWVMIAVGSPNSIGAHRWAMEK